MTKQKTQEQHGGRRTPAPLASPDEKHDDGLEADRAVFERRRKAVTSCYRARKAMEDGTRLLVKDAMDQVQKIMGQPNVMLFAMLPTPNSQDFAALLVPAKAGVELVKARWKYEILYSTATPLEEVHEALIELKGLLTFEATQTDSVRKRTWLSDRDQATVTRQKDSELRRVKSLLASLEAIVSVLDRLSEKIGAERFEVNEAMLARWDEASEKGRNAMIAEAWGAAKAVWAVKDYYKTVPANQVRMLRVLMRYRALEPILEPWSQFLKAVAELRECCSK